jgi:hypothetical protein
VPDYDWRARIYLDEARRETGRDALGTLRFAESSASEPETLRGFIERAQQIAAEADDEETRAEAEALVERLWAKLPPDVV